MWIKHNNSVFNSSYISKITENRTKLIATFEDGSEEVIGEFRKISECHNIYESIVRSLLFEDKNNPGIIIKDTKTTKKESKKK